MKILVLNYEFPPVGGGGGDISKKVSRQFAKRNHEVKVYTVRHGKLPRKEVIDGYTVYRVFAFRRFLNRCSIPEMAAFNLAIIIPLLKAIWSWKPDVLHVHFAVPTGAVAWLAHKLTGIPYVIVTHLGDIPGAQPEQTNKIFRLVKPFTIPIWKDAKHITSVSEHTALLGSKAYNVPVQVVHNGILMGDRLSSPDIQVNNIVKLILVGRFDPQKNIPFIVEALAHLAAGQWQVNILGDGKEAPIIHELIQTHNLSDRVILHGWVQPEEVEQRISESDILLLPSLYEGFSMVSLMALKYGLAIVGSDIPGIQDVVENKVSGYLCDPGSHDEFVGALSDLIDNPDKLLEMRRASYARAAEYDIGRIAEQYLAILEEAVK